jgi:hypothetical protein
LRSFKTWALVSLAVVIGWGCDQQPRSSDSQSTPVSSSRGAVPALDLPRTGPISDPILMDRSGLIAHQTATTRIEFSAADARHLLGGWNSPEEFTFEGEVEPRTVCWSKPGRSEMSVVLRAAGAIRVRMRVSNLADAQTLQIRWNDAPSRSFPLPSHDWRILEFEIAASHARAGENRLVFEAIQWVQIHDRKLEVLFDWIDFTPLGDLESLPSYARKRLGDELRSDVLESTLPGSLRFWIDRVPDDGRIELAWGTTGHDASTAKTTLRVQARSESDPPISIRDRVGGVAALPRLPGTRVVASGVGAEYLTDGDLGPERFWIGEGSRPEIRIELDPPRRLTAFALIRDVSGRVIGGYPFGTRWRSCPPLATRHSLSFSSDGSNGRLIGIVFRVSRRGSFALRSTNGTGASRQKLPR